MAAGLRQWLGAACALLAALACGEAGAHAVLLESSPAADAVLAQAPEQITLRFTEPVRPTAVRLLRAADGASVELGAPAASDAELRTALPASLPDGAYVLSYRVISADGHPVVGSFVFAIGSLGGEADAGLAAAGIADDRWRIAGVVARALWYAALLLAAGLALFLALLRTPAALAASLRFALGWLALSGILAGIGMLGGHRRSAARRHARRPRHGRALAHRARIAGGGERRGCGARRRGPGRRGARGRPPRTRAPAGGCLPRRPELWRIGPCRDRGTTLAHPPGAGTSRPVRGLVGRGLRAAAARSAAPAGRPGAGPAAGVLEPGGPGRGLPRARRDRAGGAAAAGALRPDRDRLRPPPAAQDRAGDRPSRPWRRSTAWS